MVSPPWRKRTGRGVSVSNDPGRLDLSVPSDGSAEALLQAGGGAPPEHAGCLVDVDLHLLLQRAHGKLAEPRATSGRPDALDDQLHDPAHRDRGSAANIDRAAFDPRRCRRLDVGSRNVLGIDAVEQPLAGAQLRASAIEQRRDDVWNQLGPLLTRPI